MQKSNGMIVKTDNRTYTNVDKARALDIIKEVVLNEMEGEL